MNTGVLAYFSKLWITLFTHLEMKTIRAIMGGMVTKLKAEDSIACGKLEVDKDFLFKLAKRGDKTDIAIKQLTSRFEALVKELSTPEATDFDVVFASTVTDIQGSGTAFEQNFRLLCKQFHVQKAFINFYN